jgi:signal transduction histidine kinase
MRAERLSSSKTWQAYTEGLLCAAAQLNSASAPEEILLQVVQTAAELLAVNWVAIATNEGDYALRRYTWDRTTWTACAERLPLEGSLAGWIIRHGRPIRTDALHEEPLDHPVLGTTRFQSALAVPILAREGKVLGALNLHERRDGRPFSADDQRLAEAIAHHAAVALERATLISALQARATEQDTFIHAVAHGLKTPLSAIYAVAKLLESQPEAIADGPVDSVAMIVRNAERMRQHVDDLLALARATAGLNDLVFAPVSLDEVLQTAAQELHAELQARAVQLCLDAPLPAVHGHAGRLTEMFTNLLDNAIKYTPPDRQPQIRVGATIQDGMVVCSVTDNGIGIPAEERERIFELFRRGDREHSAPASGSGVGLAIVARVVERHGGRVWVEDGAQGGSCFRVTLPAVAGGHPSKRSLVATN